MRALDHAARRRTPVVMVKVGRTETGASMALSHTGHLTGSDAVIDAVFRQYGVTRVDGLDELLDISAMFCRTRGEHPAEQPVRFATPHGAGERAEASEPRRSGERPRGGYPAEQRARPGICVYSISGGTGAHMADLASAAGLQLPELSAATQAALHDGLIPSFLRVSNPVDCGGPPVMDARGRKILDVLLEAPEIDALIVPITGAVDSMSEPMARDLVAAAATTHKPVFVVWGSPVGDERAYRETLLGSQIPVFRTFQNCVRAVRAWQDWSAFVDSYESPFDLRRATPPRREARARRVLRGAAPGAALSEGASKELLRAYGIRTTTDVLCSTQAESVQAASTLGLPVVMKICSPDLVHKSDFGLVVVGVDSLARVRRVHAELLQRARRVAPEARVEGILVCESVTDGVETLVGVSHDDVFGPVVTVGLGGVLVEVLSDVAVAVPPFSEDVARGMIESLSGRALLRGVRGRQAVDENALVDVIMTVQQLATDLVDDVTELDINPLVVRRRGAVALDALVVRRT
jgi:acetate---CoA ligase (ADP-forming)